MILIDLIVSAGNRGREGRLSRRQPLTSGFGGIAAKSAPVLSALWLTSLILRGGVLMPLPYGRGFFRSRRTFSLSLTVSLLLRLYIDRSFGRCGFCLTDERGVLISAGMRTAKSV